MLYENAIAQMLVANGHRLFFYTHYIPAEIQGKIQGHTKIFYPGMKIPLVSCCQKSYNRGAKNIILKD